MCKDGPGPLGPRCKKVEEDVHEIGNNIKEDGMIGASIFIIIGMTKVRIYYPQILLPLVKDAICNVILTIILICYL